MPVIRSDGHLSDGKGNHADFAFSYVSFERVLEAFDQLRALSVGYGHYHRSTRGRESYNLGLDRRRGSPLDKADNIPTGVVLPFKVTTLDAPTGTPGRKTVTFNVRLNRENPSEQLPHTSAGGSTLNAIAWALATGGRDANGVVVPKLTEGWLPQRFSELWTVRAAQGEDLSDESKQEEWGQGAARAIQHFNLGVQIDPLQLHRGDAVQLGASPAAPHRSSAAFCFATRRVRGDEVRFVYLSSQIDTAGIGVRLNDLARMGILSQGPLGEARVKVRIQGESGQALGDHRFMLQVSDRVFVGRSAEDGKVDVVVSGEARTGYLSFWVKFGSDDDDDDDDEECITWPLKVQRYEGNNGSDEGSEGRAREEFVVAGGSRPFKLFVYHPGSLSRSRFVTHALRYGNWQILAPGEQGKHALLGPWKGHVHAARLHAEFPRYPIALFGSNDLDYLDADGNEADLERTTRRYYRNTERLTGGYFPLGRSRVWHGGVHLEPQTDKTVFAPFDGRVVAARLCDPNLADNGERRFPFGSPNFVLLRHACKIEGTEHVFFTLLMHLGDPELRLVGEVGGERLLSQHAAELPWLREIALAPDAPEEKQEGETVDPTKLYFKVHRQTNPPTQLGDVELEVGDLLEVAGSEVSGEQWAVWNGLQAGEVKRVGDGAQGSLDGKAFLEQGGLIAPFDAYTTQFTEVKQKLLDGDVVDLWEHELFVRCGEPVGRIGTWHDAERLHVEIFSKDLIPMKVPVPGENGAEPTWEAKAAVDVDTAGDNQCYFDRATFMDDFFAAVEDKANESAGLDGDTQALRVRERLLGNVTSKDDGAVIREEEIQTFFNDEHNSLLPFFRNLVVRHLSEWGDKVKWKELETAKETLGKPLGPFLKKLGEQTEEYCWWTADVGKDADLPADQVVHHYHPISFLRWLEHERTQELPKGQADDLHTSVLEAGLKEGPSGGGGAAAASDDDDDETSDDGKRALVLRLCDATGGALEQKRYELQIGGETLSGESEAGGVIEQRIPKTAFEGHLKVWAEDGNDDPQSCPVKFA